jgi:BirA family biotin operon repressor/biotin-[acetyl-CoA-carboxylase] ligase
MPAIENEQLADRLLSKIRRKPGRLISLSSLSKTLQAEPAQVLSALAHLKSLGYKIRRKKDSLTFVAAPDLLIDTEITYQLKSKLFGRKTFTYRSVKSTNDIAIQLAQAGETEGTIVTAEQQTKGRGRLGRAWHSPAGRGVYVSIILRPAFKPDRAPGIAVMTALALADAVADNCHAKVQIKWPNDLLINGRKAAGILTELSAEKNKVEYIVVGVGINVNHTVDDFPQELQPIATSLRIANRRKAARVDLLKTFLSNFEREYRRYQKEYLASSRKKIRKYSSLVGKEVRLRFGNKVIEGRAIDIDKDGALIVEKDGQRRAVTSGEVTVVKEGNPE